MKRFPDHKNRTVKCLLSVNINKIATLRNSRGGDNPNLLYCAEKIVSYGALGLTIHPRPDERHIRYSDVPELKKLIQKLSKTRNRHIEFNIEGYPSGPYLNLIRKYKPDQATLVPDPPHAITSNAGWKLWKNRRKLKKIVRQIQSQGVRVSLFVDPFTWSTKETLALKDIQPDRIELYTESYAKGFQNKKGLTGLLAAYQKVAEIAHQLGIAINAGHDLDTQNLPPLLKAIPQIQEVSIGHALISDSLFWGLSKTIKRYKRACSRKSP